MKVLEYNVLSWFDKLTMTRNVVTLSYRQTHHDINCLRTQHGIVCQRAQRCALACVSSL